MSVLCPLQKEYCSSNVWTYSDVIESIQRINNLKDGVSVSWLTAADQTTDVSTDRKLQSKQKFDIIAIDYIWK